jgi:transposase
MATEDAPFSLTPPQRVRLRQLVRITRDARLLRRAQALLWRDAGESVTGIATRLGVSRQTVHNWVRPFSTRSGTVVERLADELRTGRPRTALGIVDPLLAEFIDGNPQEYGYAATAWTAPLLQKHLAEPHGIAVSLIRVRRAIHRLRRRGKRPRCRLALRPATWRQAKGGSSAALTSVGAR